MSTYEISQITLPDNHTYDLRDSRVDNLNGWSYVVCTSASNTPKDVTWNNAGTTVTGTLVASSDTMFKIYLVPDNNGTNDIYDEYITVNPSGSTYKWEMFGNTKLPDMSQYAKNASGHSGGTVAELAYKSSASGSVNIPSSYSFSGTGVRLETDSQVMTGASFSGSSSTFTGNYTPSGTISKGTGTANYTPEGSNASSSVSGNITYTPAGGTAKTNEFTPAGSVSVASAGATDTIYGIDSVGSLPSATMPTYTVTNKVLTITAGSFSAGALPTKTAQKTFKTGDASYNFSGTKITSSFSGTAAAQTFTGTGAELKFTGTQGSVSVSGTPSGSVSETKSKVTVSPASSGTATYTPAGSVSTAGTTPTAVTVS